MDSTTFDGLKAKQIPVDIWTTREQLCLASAVSQAGDKNWNAVSKTIQQITSEKSRPQDWYSTRNCALQYARLVEQVEASKKKKERELLAPNETIQQFILKILSKKRGEEVKEILEEKKSDYNKLRKEILLLESNQLDSKLHQFWNDMIKEQDVEMEEYNRLKAFLREREEKIKLTAKSQLLKAPSVPPSPKQKTWTSPSHKISSALEVSSGSVDVIKNDVDLKERLPKIEEISNESPTKSTSQNLSANLFPPDRTTIGQKKEDEGSTPKGFPIQVKQEEEEEEAIKMPEDSFENPKCDSSFESNLPLDYTSNLNVEREDETVVPNDDSNKKILETTETCVDNVEGEDEEKEDLRKEGTSSEGQTSVQQYSENSSKEHIKKVSTDEVVKTTTSTELVSEEDTNKEVEKVAEESEEIDTRKKEEKESRKQKWKKKNLPLLSVSKEDLKEKLLEENDHMALIKKDDSDKLQEADLRKAGTEPSSATPAADYMTEKEPEKKPMRKEIKDEYEFDDDASRESTDVNFSLCRDYTYSRSDRRKFSLSENVSSPVISESTPSSPASTNYGDDPEMEKMHRSWKRSIMLIWNDIAAHKNASLFLKPITEEKVPGYNSVIFRPIDLLSIKRSIENGTIRSTLDFQRDMMLMFMNAKMYNTRDNNIYRMADHMMNDAVETIEEFIQAQMLAKVVETPQKNLRRETRESSAKRVGDDVKRKREDKEDKTMKRRKIM